MWNDWFTPLPAGLIPLTDPSPDIFSRAYQVPFFEKMVDTHCCVRDEGGFTLHWLVAFLWVGVRIRVYIL